MNNTKNTYIAKLERLIEEVRQLKELVQERDNIHKPINPFEYVRPDLEQYKVLVFYNGAYYDIQGKDKGALYKALSLTEPQVKNWLRNVEEHNLSAHLKHLPVEVAIAVPLFTGDLITTLGHIISSKSHSIRLYKSRINNIINLVYDGVAGAYNLGELMYSSFVDDTYSARKQDDPELMIIYTDKNFANNRIENLNIGKL